MDIFNLNMKKKYNLIIDTFNVLDGVTVLVSSKVHNDIDGLFLKNLLSSFFNNDCLSIEFTTFYKPHTYILNISFEYVVTDINYITLLFLSSPQE